MPRYPVIIATWLVLASGVACRADLLGGNGKDDTKAGDAPTEEAAADGPTLPVDVAGSYLMGIGPASTDLVPAGFVAEGEELFGVGVYRGAAKVVGKVSALKLELTFKDGAGLVAGSVEVPDLVPAAANARWHAYFKLAKGRISLVASASLSAVVNDVAVANATETFTFVPPDAAGATVVETAAGQSNATGGDAVGAGTGTGGDAAAGTSGSGSGTGQTGGSGDTATGTTTGSATGTTSGTATGSATGGSSTGTGFVLEDNKQYAFATARLVRPGASFDASVTDASAHERFDSVADADEICSAFAVAAGLVGSRVWVAALSDGMNPLSSRLTVPDPLHLVNGDFVMNGIQFYANPADEGPLNRTAAGDAVVSPSFFTGSTATGSAAMGSDCDGWQSDSSALFTVAGSGAGGFPGHLNYDSTTCHDPLRLLCVTKSKSSGFTLDSDKQYLFVSSRTAIPASNYDGSVTDSEASEHFISVAQADTICAALASKAGLTPTRTWKAVLSSSSESVASRLSVTSPLHLVNGDSVMPSAVFYMGTASEGPINRDENGVIVPDPLYYWTGSTDGGGADMNTCGDWTDSAIHGAFGDGSGASVSHLSSTFASCGSVLRLLCATTP